MVHLPTPTVPDSELLDITVCNAIVAAQTKPIRDWAKQMIPDEIKETVQYFIGLAIKRKPCVGDKHYCPALFDPISGSNFL